MNATSGEGRKQFNRSLVYWLAQILGWVTYSVFLGFVLYASEKFSTNALKGVVMSGLLGIILTHLYRLVIHKLNWVKLSALSLIPRVLLAAFIYGVVHYLAVSVIFFLVFEVDYFNLQESVNQVPHWTLVCTIWSLIYFAFHLVEKSRNEEIKNLQVQAFAREIELNNLKSQLNPHFMFNAMNSIRALVDDEPERAKVSITQLSNILRSTLLMGRKKLVRLEEELMMIRDYLRLEEVRYEERLQVDYEIGEGTTACYIPPLMLQTLVENGIKHGIATLTKGGQIRIVTQLKDDNLLMRIENTGTLKNGSTHGTGTGISNTIKRLELLYDDKAKFDIYNQDDLVITEIRVPKQTKHEGNNH